MNTLIAGNSGHNKLPEDHRLTAELSSAERSEQMDETVDQVNELTVHAEALTEQVNIQTAAINTLTERVNILTGHVEAMMNVRAPWTLAHRLRWLVFGK